MHGEGDRSALGRWAEHLDAVRRIGVEHELTDLPASHLGDARHQRGQLLGGDGDDHEFCSTDHLQGLEHRHIREHGGGAFVVGSTGDPDHGMPRASERRTDDRPDAPCADDADAEATVTRHRRSSSAAAAGVREGCPTQPGVRPEVPAEASPPARPGAPQGHSREVQAAESPEA